MKVFSLILPEEQPNLNYKWAFTHLTPISFCICYISETLSETDPAMITQEKGSKSEE